MSAYEDARARLVDRWVAAAKRTTNDVLQLGQLAHAAICAKIKGIKDSGSRRSARAEAIKDMQSALGDAGCDLAAELQRWIACWAVADCLGMDQAKTMPIGTLRGFMPLVRRDSKRETWALRKTFASFATDLWTRAATMKSAEVAAAVRAEANKDRKPRAAKPPVDATVKVLKVIETLDLADQRRLFHALREKFGKVMPLSQAVAHAEGNKPVQPQPQSQPGFMATVFGTGKRAG